MLCSDTKLASTGIFVGYSETSKAYRIFIPGQKTIELSRDVVFEEDLAFKKAINSNEPSPLSNSESISESESQKENLEEVEDEVNLEESSKKRPLWAIKTVEAAQDFAAPSGSVRESKRPKRFSGYTTNMIDLSKTEPTNLSDAIKHPAWKEAMTEEYQSIMKNDVWEIVPRPKGKSIVSSKWIFKIKHAADGSIEKYKARFVARGFSQKEGIDYEETFAPVARYTTVRAVLAIAASKGWKVHQMDVKTTFLNGKISEEVFIEQPEGFETHDPNAFVCRLKKALYGLKQAPRAWYERIDKYLTSLGFSKNEADPNLYYKRDKDGMVILILYVDDLLITGDDHLIVQCKKDLIREFEMKDLGLLHYFLGLEVRQNVDNIILNQRKYTSDILKKFGMWNCKSMSCPMETNLHKLVQRHYER